MTRDEFIYRLLCVTAMEHTDDLWWRYRHGGSGPINDTDVLDFYIECNDLFAWGCSDCESVTPDRIAVLEQAYKDCPDAGGALYCSRIRQMRPQGAWFCKGYIEAKDMHWFAACGPERKVGYGNPYPFLSEEEFKAQQAAKAAKVEGTDV